MIASTVRHTTKHMAQDLMDLRLWTYSFILMSGGVGIWIVRELMAKEADQQLPSDEKIRRTIWSRTGFKSGEMSRLWQAHQQFFPGSLLRFWYVALWVLTLSWMFFGLNLLNHLPF
jgi:hypothetical protein